MIATIRETDIAAHVVHGNGRRPEREFRVDMRALAKWNAAQRAAVAVNRDRPRAEARRDAIVIRDSGL